MNSAKRCLVIAVSFAVCMIVFTAFFPHIAQAVSATMVQVVNTSQNPVPVQPMATTQLLFGQEIQIPNGDEIYVGPFDVSPAREVRVTCDQISGGSFWGASLQTISPLNTMISDFSFRNLTDTTERPTQVIELPGTQARLHLAGNGGQDVVCWVYGRSN